MCCRWLKWKYYLNNCATAAEVYSWPSNISEYISLHAIISVYFLLFNSSIFSLISLISHSLSVLPPSYPPSFNLLHSSLSLFLIVHLFLFISPLFCPSFFLFPVCIRQDKVRERKTVKIWKTWRIDSVCELCIIMSEGWFKWCISLRTSVCCIPLPFVGL